MVAAATSFYPPSEKVNFAAMPSIWHPVHENHAIDVMAAVVAFSEPIPELPFKRILKASEDVAFAEGLRSRHSIHGGTMEIAVSSGGGQPLIGTPLGRSFHSLEEISDQGPVPARIVEQLQITTTQIV